MNGMRLWLTNGPIRLRYLASSGLANDLRPVSVAFETVRHGSHRANRQPANPDRVKKHFKYRSRPGASRKPRIAFTTLGAELGAAPNLDDAEPEERDAVAAVFDGLADIGVDLDAWPPDVDARVASLTLQLLRSEVTVDDAIKFFSNSAAVGRRLLEDAWDDEHFAVVKTLTKGEVLGAALLSVLHHADGRVFELGVERLIDNMEALRQRKVTAEALVPILRSSPAALVDFSASDWDERQAWFAHNFTQRHFVELLPRQGRVLTDRLEDIERKFNYVFFRMGLDQKQMLECRLFSHSFHHIKSRHQFLRRSGVYKYPDPKRRVLNLNPHLQKILDWDDLRFIQHVPGAELKHYRVFSALLAEEDDEDEDDVDGESDDSDDEDEETQMAAKMQQSSGLNIRKKRKSN